MHYIRVSFYYFYFLEIENITKLYKNMVLEVRLYLFSTLARNEGKINNIAIICF